MAVSSFKRGSRRSRDGAQGPEHRARFRIHAACRLTRAERARRNAAHMIEELPRARSPGELQRMLPAGLPRLFERHETGTPQVVVERAHRRIAEYVLGTRYRKGRNGYTARQRFELDDAEGVRLARKDEYVGRGHMYCELLPAQRAEELRLGIPRAQFRFLRPVSDHDLGAKQLERQERLEVLLRCYPADTHENRAWKPKIDRALRPEQLGIDTAAPNPEPLKPSRCKLVLQRRR